MNDNPYSPPRITPATEDPEGLLGKILAVLCLALFWLLPFSPLVAVVAVAKTRNTPGWARTVAKTGAMLSSILVVALAGLLLWILVVASINGFSFAF